jgi:hypothetical protein
MGFGELWGKVWEFGGKRLGEVGSKIGGWGWSQGILCKRIHDGI